MFFSLKHIPRGWCKSHDLTVLTAMNSPDYQLLFITVELSQKSILLKKLKNNANHLSESVIIAITKHKLGRVVIIFSYCGQRSTMTGVSCVPRESLGFDLNDRVTI